MSDSPITIRLAEPQDLETIVAFIQALAHYEHLEHQVVGQIEDLRQHLFPETRNPHHPPIEAILAAWEDMEVGFALFFPNYSTFEMKPGLYLEDLFVLPKYRKQGIGRAIFRYLARLAVQRGYSRFEWRVLDWNDIAIGFYQRMGAEVLTDWYTCRLTGQNLIALGDDPS